MIPKLRILALPLFLALVAPRWAAAQGFIVDRRPHVPIARSYEVREVTVDARMRDQVAEVQVTQTFHNPGSTVIEAEYLFPMPEEGAIQNFVLLVDGKELPGRLLPKDEARRIYEDIVRSKRDPALLEYMGRGAFRTSVFPIPAGADRKVTMRYTQLCKRDRDVVEFAYPFGTQKFTAKPIDRLLLTASIDNKDPIKSVYSPSHDCEVKRSGDRNVTFRLEQHNVIPNADFRLVYTLAEGAIGATVLSYRASESEDGYFLLLASPEVKRPDERPKPKTVVFVLDRSGSMSGKKIEQARNALKFCLDNLRDDDLFNVVVYDDRVVTWKPELQRYSRETRGDAIRYVENIQPGGSTNIDDALKTAISLIKDESRPNYVLFLTDGLPTAGETRETAIADHVRTDNKLHSRLFVFGVGFDVNARLLDRLSGGNGGTSEYVKPDDDIEGHVARFYAKLTSPVLASLAVEFGSTDINRTYPRDIPDLFEGGQLVWVGRYRDAGKTTVTISGKVGGERQSFSFPVELARAGENRSYEFVEKLWAVRRVGFLIDQIDLHGKNKELVDEMVALSTKYGILTPYTSFLADENVRLYDLSANTRRAGANVRELETVEGRNAVAQRAAKGVYQQADRFGAAAGAARLGQSDFDSLANQPGVALDRGRVMTGVVRAPAAVGGGGLGGQATELKEVMVVRDEKGNAKVVDTVRHIGAKTFYRKGERWVDSSLKPDDEKNATIIEQFTDDYFKLARGQSAEMNQYLTFAEPVVVELGGKVYKIERPKAK